MIIERRTEPLTAAQHAIGRWVASLTILAMFIALAIITAAALHH